MNSTQQVESWKELADRVLDMGESAITNIIETIKSIAPHLWEILIKQVYVEAISYALMFIGTTIIIYIPFKYYFKKYEEMTNCDRRVNFAAGSIITGILLLVTSIFSVICIVELIGVCINPEYYAIQKFFEMVGGLR